MPFGLKNTGATY
jgi:hypothetical protein